MAARRCEPAAAPALWRERQGRFIVAGLVLAAIRPIPLAHLAVPVLGAAFMTHAFHGAVGATAARAPAGRMAG